MRRKNLVTLLALTLAVADRGALNPALAASEASADQAPAAATTAPAAGELPTVVVTARLRSEVASETPEVVQVISGETLELSGVTDMSHLDLLAPNVFVATGFLLDSMHVRGLGTTSANAGFEQQVGLFIDGVYYGNGHWINGSLLDVDNLAILKGPQGVYLGKNTIAGAFDVTTKNPGDRLEAYAKVGYETESRERYGEGVISVPLSSDWGVRLAVRGTDMDGWVRQLATGEKLPGIRDIDGRLTIDYHPSRAFDANLKFFVDNYHDLGPDMTTMIIGCGPGNTMAPLMGWGPQSGGQPCAIPYTTGSGTFYDDYNGGNHVYDQIDNYAASLNMHWRQSSGELTSITSWNKYRLTNFSTQLSSKPTGEGFVPAIDDSKNTTYSQQLHYQTTLSSPVNFLLGAYYQHTDFVAHDAFLLYPQSFEGPGMWSTDNNNGGPGTTLAVFGELQWAISKELELDVSARWTRDHKDFFWNNVGCGGFFCGVAPLGGITDSATENNVSPQAVLRWRPNDNTMLYAAYKTGFLAGGYSATGFLFAGTGPGGFQPASDLRFGPEKTKGGEIGSKFYLLDRKLYLDLAGFYYRYTDLQVNTFDPKTISFHVQNAGKVINTGGELSATWQLGAGFRAAGDLAYTKSYYAEFIGSCLPTTPQECTVPTSTPLIFQQNFSGQPTDFAPLWSGRIAFDYEHQFSGDLALRAAAGVSFSDPYLISQFPIQPGYAKYDAQLSMDRGPWTFAFIGQNLSNKLLCTESAGRALTTNPSEVQCVTERGRELRFELTLRFQ